MKGYNIIDLINKTIKIANKRKTIYENIGQKKCDIPSIEIISKVLVKEEDITIQYFEMLIKEVDETGFEEINCLIYDKISFLINEFNQRLCMPEIKDVREYMKFSLALEKDLHFLLIEIQGKFVTNADDIHTKTYTILSDMINNINRHIIALEKTIR